MPDLRYKLYEEADNLDLNASDAQERVQKIHAKLVRLQEVEDAYKVLSQALNRGDQDLVLEALCSEHSTLIGKLANVVMEAVHMREHDGRLTTFNMTIGEILGKTGWDRDTRLSEIRQPFI